MTSAWLWIVALVIGTAAVCRQRRPPGQAAAHGLDRDRCLAFALLAVWDRRRLVAAGGSEPALASATASSMAARLGMGRARACC